MHHPPAIALDGHDGSGKSTLARALADRLGVRYVRPFGDTLGDMIAWLWGGQRFELADQLARTAVEKVLAEHATAGSLVFDRNWLTMFTVLPEEYFERWRPRCPTVLIWTTPERTLERLRERGEDPGDPSVHAHYCASYRALAERFDVPIIDTTDLTEAQALDALLQLEAVHALGDDRNE